MTHWALPLIGAPWKQGASGPNAFDCWGLVRHVCATRHGIDLAPSTDIAAIRSAAHTNGWRPATAPAMADDVVFMRGPAGRHVGVMVQANGRLGVLHAAGHQTPRGPVGEVIFQPLADATAGGYHSFEFWRLG